MKININMKTAFFTMFLLFLAVAGIKAQGINPRQSLDKRDTWTQKDLMQPADLAASLANAKAKQAYIFNIGVVEDIKGAKNIGGASDKANLEKFRQELSKLPKSAQVVVYCGCCPFERCPNIRPAFNLMKSMGYTNGKLLNIPTNLKQNWIDKGYPMAKK